MAQSVTVCGGICQNTGLQGSVVYSNSLHSASRFAFGSLALQDVNCTLVPQNPFLFFCSTSCLHFVGAGCAGITNDAGVATARMTNLHKLCKQIAFQSTTDVRV